MKKQDLKQTISVLLVDDHPVVRDGYRRLLEIEQDIKVVAEANDGETGCEQYKKYSPDVVVIDLSMPGIGGLETIRRIKAQDEEAHILVFSMHNNEIMVRHALGAGAMGYLTKQGGMELMVKAVREVACGKLFIDPELAANMSSGKLLDISEDSLSMLSQREFQIFKLFAEGVSTSQIADTLSISAKTVGVHHTNIMKKLGLQNTAQIVRIAIRCNIIQP